MNIKLTKAYKKTHIIDTSCMVRSNIYRMSVCGAQAWRSQIFEEIHGWLNWGKVDYFGVQRNASAKKTNSGTKFLFFSEFDKIIKHN